jgi:hypothetical protein
MKIAFVLLAHEPPEHLRLLIETLLASGSDVFVHYDLNAPHDLARAAENWGLEGMPGRLFHAPRVKVAWGEWSIVQGTLNCLRLAREQGYGADYFMLISGSCMPVKPVYRLKAFLAENPGIDFIEAVNALEKTWVTGGIQKQRWSKYHFFNWRTHARLFDFSLYLQRKLKLNRLPPLGHVPHMGSQWWCLRRHTVDAILSLTDRHPVLERFYRRTWVPDELFFQTMVGNLIPAGETRPEILTRYAFNSWGVPRVYYDDDLPELLAETTFFARKISHRAVRLRQSLKEVCALPNEEYQNLVSEPDSAYAQALRQRLELQRDLQKIEWFSLVPSNGNPYEYIKSIPNTIIVVASLDKNLRKRALDEFRRMPDCVVYGDILDGKCLEFGEGGAKVAGYAKQDVALARFNWHLFLGELAFRAPGKIVVFSLGASMLQYIDVLRWKMDLGVVYLDALSAEEGESPKVGLGSLLRLEKARQQDESIRTGMFKLLKDGHCMAHVVESGAGSFWNESDATSYVKRVKARISI